MDIKTLAHLESEMNLTVLDLEMNLLIWEKRNKKENTEQRERIEKLKWCGTHFNELVGAVIMLKHKLAESQLTVLAQSGMIEGLQKELEQIKAIDNF